MPEKLTFSTTKIVIPVDIDGKDYFLSEATGHANSVFRDAMLQGATVTKGGSTSIGKVAQAELGLLSMCLRDGKEKNVPEGTIKGWPNRIVEALTTKLREISGMNDDDEDTVKNSGKGKKAGSS